MNDINKVIIVGRLTKDPELSKTATGVSFTNFSIASNESYKKGEEKVERVNFIECVAWSKLAEIVCQYAKKGVRLVVEGRLKQERWENQDGKKQSKIRIYLDACLLASGGKSDSDSGAAEPSDMPSVEAQGNMNFSDDDIPF